jgi:hypothetical protein
MFDLAPEPASETAGNLVYNNNIQYEFLGENRGWKIVHLATFPIKYSYPHNRR